MEAESIAEPHRKNSCPSGALNLSWRSCQPHSCLTSAASKFLPSIATALSLTGRMEFSVVCARYLAAHDQQIEDATILRLYGDFEASAEQGEYRSYREVLSSVVRQFGEQFGFAPSEEQVRSLAESLKEWKPWPDTVEALRLLESRFRLAIISNVDDDLFAATLPQLEGEIQPNYYRPAGASIQTVLEDFRTCIEPHWRSRAPCPACWAESLSRCDSCAVARLATVWVNRPSARKGVGAVKAAEAQPDLQVTSLAELAAACAQA